MSDRWGGRWTVVKLRMLNAYLSAYTSALKNKPFKNKPFNLMYIDAFAGVGEVDLKHDRHLAPNGLIKGSALSAAQIVDKPFDRLILIDKSSGRIKQLRDNLSASGFASDLDTRIHTFAGDANEVLQKNLEKWDLRGKGWRGVLFLDPYAMATQWATIEAIANCEALDVWILFPIAATRILPTDQRPEGDWEKRLNTIFGGPKWKDLYHNSQQMTLDGDVEEVSRRDKGPGGVVKLYKDNLESIFGERLLKRSFPLRTGRGTPMFEFIFCTGSPDPAAIRLAEKLAGDIIKKGEKWLAQEDQA